METTQNGVSARWERKKARFPYKCEFCGEAIPVGSFYLDAERGRRAHGSCVQIHPHYLDAIQPETDAEQLAEAKMLTDHQEIIGQNGILLRMIVELRQRVGRLERHNGWF